MFKTLRTALLATSLASTTFATTGTAAEARLSQNWSVPGLGAIQGLAKRGRNLYIYGDRGTGVIAEVQIGAGGSLRSTGRSVDLGVVARHPTGLTHRQGIGTFLGNTVNRKGEIYNVDWERLWSGGSFAAAVLNVTEDDLAIQGSRPEFVRVGGRWLIATADYGGERNEIRLYDPQALATAARTSDPGVLVAKLASPPWVQNLHWIADRGLLVLVQNQTEGLGWRLTLVNLESSLASGRLEVAETIDFAPRTELEGFTMISRSRGLAVDSSGNLQAVDWRW